VSVTVRLGALSHISAHHFREHFEEAARGGPAEGADLVVETSGDESDPRAQDIMLESVEVEAL
jgi:hydrogenase nickel incorporation protein HypA/HybF